MDARLLSLGAGVLVVVTVGCGESAPSNPVPSAPTPVAASPPTPVATVSGTVWVHDGGGVRPDANSRMFGWVQQANYGSTTGQVPTDANGRFSFTVPVGAKVRMQSAAAGAFQPCQVVVRANGDVTEDIHVVRDPQQLGAHLPEELLARTPVLSGVVFERAGDGRRMPLADVRLEMDGLYGLGWVAATTMTDADGRYVLCGLADDPSTYLFASKAGYRQFESTVTLGGNTTLDIELSR
jgi:hypothetical protein